MDDADSSELELHDFEPARATFREDVLRGLQQRPRELPCKYLYDAEGSRLFDRICRLDEYYPTRTEISIMHASAREMAKRIGPRCLLIEYGSGSSVKTRLLLDRLEAPIAYVPVDISREHLLRSAHEIAARHPEMEVLPVCADFTGSFDLPPTRTTPARRVVYFPGSTIGNLSRADARQFLCSIRKLCEGRDALLIGVDLQKDTAVLEAAYDDRQGVTAAFNRNLLARINRDLGANFDLAAFEHRAFYREDHGRVEMHLVSTRKQLVRVDGESFRFGKGETIHTESSHKYTVEGFADLAGSAGFGVEKIWTDEEDLFSVQLLTVS